MIPVGETVDTPVVMQPLSALVDASLVMLDRASDEGRYRMLDVTREYAVE